MPKTQKTATVLNKTVGVPLRKEAMTKSETGSLIVSGYFTSDTTDMHGDIITRAATERAINTYRQWGNIRRMHAPDPVGKVVGIGVEDGLEWNEVKIEVIDPKAVFEVENGLLQALSIGAMIMWEDITWMEDGGMLINDYLLGEISLVDHPANYDAYLKDENSAKTAVQMLVRQYGIDILSKGMLNILEEHDMAENSTEKELDVTEDATETTPEAEVEGTEEENVEATKEVTEETEDETVAEDVTEDTTDETETEEEATAETEEVEDGDPVNVGASIDEETETEEEDNGVEKRLENIERMVTTLVEKFAGAPVVETEESAEDQDTDDAVAEEDTTDVPEDAHKAVVPPTEDVDLEDKAEETPSRKTLHQALTDRFSPR